MRRFAVATLAAFGIGLASGPGALAQNISCTTSLTGNVVNGNLVVPAGANCELIGVTVAGNVSVGESATFLVFASPDQPVKIGGNIDAEGCNVVQLSDGPISVGGNVRGQNCSAFAETSDGGTATGITIGGNFVCQGTASCLVENGKVAGSVSMTAATTEATLAGAAIGGNVALTENNGSSSISDAAIGGNAEVAGNSTGGEVGVVVGGNVIRGNLQCQGNTPGVVALGFGPNTVAGNKLGQCAGL